MSDAVEETEPAPWAMQLAARVPKLDPPGETAICEVAVLAALALLDHEWSAPGGPWHEAVSTWDGMRIRKIVRRARGANWDRGHEADGVTVERDGVAVRAFVPSPTDRVPERVRKLQIQTPPLDPPDVADDADVVRALRGLVIAVTPSVPMSWGKRAAQCAHAGQLVRRMVDPTTHAAWVVDGRPVTVVHPDEATWAVLVDEADVEVHDGGFTEIPAGTKTALGWLRV